jgi:hypothetical protein
METLKTCSVVHELTAGQCFFTAILQHIFQDSKQTDGTKNIDMTYRHAQFSVLLQSIHNTLKIAARNLMQ